MKEAELLKFIHETEEHYFVEAPKNFKENILIQTNALPVKAVHEAGKLSKNMQLFLYSMKVCTAVLVVLLFLNFSHTIHMLHGGVRDFSVEKNRDTGISAVLAENTTDLFVTLLMLSYELLNLGGIFDD